MIVRNQESIRSLAESPDLMAHMHEVRPGRRLYLTYDLKRAPGHVSKGTRHANRTWWMPACGRPPVDRAPQGHLSHLRSPFERNESGPGVRKSLEAGLSWWSRLSKSNR